MPESSPDLRHARRLENGEGPNLAAQTEVIARRAIEALTRMADALKQDPENMLRGAFGSGPALPNPLVATFEIKVHHPLTEYGTVTVEVISSMKVERFNPDHISFKMRTSIGSDS